MVHVAARRLVMALALHAAAAVAPAVAQTTEPFTVRSCAETNLALGADAEGGAFDGIAYSGVMVTLTNTSAAACSIPRRPSFHFEDASHAPVTIVRQNAPPSIGMHPGPVMVPIVLAPGASTTSILGWQSSDVTDGGRCAYVAELALTLAPLVARADAPVRLTTPQSAHLCGGADPSPILFDATEWSAPAPPASPVPAVTGR